MLPFYPVPASVKTIVFPICLLLLFLCNEGYCQTNTNSITVLGDAYEEVIANEVTLSITISYDDEKDAHVAYEEHQKALTKIAGLLNELKVQKQNIHILPLQSRKGRNYRQGQPTERFTTYQTLLIRFDDLKQYDEVQRNLNTNGFGDLTATFSVSNEQEVELRLLNKALEHARQKADQLAKATSRSLKRIIRISDVGENENLYGYREYSMRHPSRQTTGYENDPIRQMAMVSQAFKYAAAVIVEYELSDL